MMGHPRSSCEDLNNYGVTVSGPGWITLQTNTDAPKVSTVTVDVLPRAKAVFSIRKTVQLRKKLYFLGSIHYPDESGLDTKVITVSVEDAKAWSEANKNHIVRLKKKSERKFHAYWMLIKIVNSTQVIIIMHRIINPNNLWFTQLVAAEAASNSAIAQKEKAAMEDMTTPKESSSTMREFRQPPEGKREKKKRKLE